MPHGPVAAVHKDHHQRLGPPGRGSYLYLGGIAALSRHLTAVRCGSSRIRHCSCCWASSEVEGLSPLVYARAQHSAAPPSRPDPQSGWRPMPEDHSVPAQPILVFGWLQGRQNLANKWWAASGVRITRPLRPPC
ncbi:hypothetical protein NDU88_003421 [Pleurodeles waltl]|uniref:Uncharacterized protein n=1 Tax=Pleurodeles waltl TaxID=8319 RepID=A0AAV7TNE1_PLEWA|nr:hypothetical protein NDU88_003421 [Pleurodeles waltl]